jgi:hypothetical protein
MHGAIFLLPQYVSMAWCLVKHRENFAFIRSYVNTSTKHSALHCSNHVTYEGVSKSFRTGPWSEEDCKWYRSPPLGAVVSLFCESV